MIMFQVRLKVFYDKNDIGCLHVFVHSEKLILTTVRPS